jgi:N-carbamoylputrescine amidase
MSENKREVRIAGIQMSCKAEAKEENLKKALNLIDRAAEDGAKIICLQESFNTEWSSYKRDKYPEAFKYAEYIPGPTINEIIEKAKQHEVYIIPPILEIGVPGVYYNTAPLISPNGQILGKYRKLHISGDEVLFFTPGVETPVFKTKYGKVGIMICYDRQFPELWRILTLKGAEVIFLPYATWWDGHWDWINRTSAFQNSIFALHVNRVGVEGDRPDLHFFGRSHIIDPEGTVIAEGSGESDDIVAATIDLEMVKRTRFRRSMLRNRRVDLYDRILRSPDTELA